MKPTISVIIPTFNRSEILLETLKSVIDQSLDARLFEIIIVDTFSIDNTKEACTEFITNNKNLNIRYIYSATPGLLAGRHNGVIEATADVLVFIDDDISVSKDWLELIADSFVDKHLQILGGKSLPLFESKPTIKIPFLDTPYGGSMCPSLSLLDLGEKEMEVHPNYVWGLNFSIRKKTLLDLDGFHPDAYPTNLLYLRGDGETGLTLKAHQRGLKSIYQPRNLVFHRIPTSRLQNEYLEFRDYLQGVSDSYTKIRSDGLQEIDIIHGSEDYQKGFKYHHQLVNKNKNLLQWVTKENYWEYDIAKFKIV